MEPLRRYTLAISILGIGLLAVLLATTGMSFLAHAPLEFWVFAAAVIGSELMPLRMLHRGADGEITPSTTFAFALLLAFGTVPAVIAQVVGSGVADLLHRKPAERVVFNLAQYTLALAASGVVLAAMTEVPRAGHDPFLPADLPGILLAAAVFFVVNAVLVAGAVSLSQGLPFWRYLKRDLVLQFSTVGVLLGLAPIVVLASDFSLLVLPLLGLPLFAVHRAGHQAVSNEHQALHDALTGL